MRQMEALSWGAAIGAFLATIFSVATAYTAARRQRFSEREFEMRAELQGRLLEDLARSVRYNDSASGIFSSDRTTQSLLRAINRLSDNISASVESPKRIGHADERQENSAESTNIALNQVVAEVSHSLNTPLQQIELTLDYLQGVALPGLPSNLLSQAQESVGLCRSVLSAYRDITGFSRLESSWDIDNLEESIVGALSILMRAHGSEAVTGEIVAPAKIEGYSNYFLLAVLLPLFENAVEASGERGRISCQIVRSHSEVVLTVRNSVQVSPALEDLEKVGYTSKDKETPGLGLASVRTLLARRRGQMNFEVEGDGFVSVRIILPARTELD